MQAIHQQTHIKREKETIHSGHFMVSDFEAEEQDDDDVAVPIPEEETPTSIVPVHQHFKGPVLNTKANPQQLAIDTSLAKLFQCMSLAYRQKLTSPKWNRFRGIRLRWKDKIRLNNVIWRCWHLQFIKKENTLICQFASPLDVDTHNKPEAVVLEGKYWKRKLAAVTAEYKKWRMFYRNHAFGQILKDEIEMLSDADLLAWNSQSTENVHMMVDEDYMGLMSDTLFSTITNQPFVFPDSREIAKAGLADFIQPSLGPLQPNLDDYMDTFEPLQEFMAGKLPTVPEEQGQSHWSYPELDLIGSSTNLQQVNSNAIDPFQNQLSQSIASQSQLYQNDDVILSNSVDQYVTQQTYNSSVISKSGKPNKIMPQNQIFTKNLTNNLYYSTTDCNINERLQASAIERQAVNIISSPTQQFKIPQQDNLQQNYKFSTPATVKKFTSQVSGKHTMLPPIHSPSTSVHSQYSVRSVSVKEEKPENRIKMNQRSGTRQRSRSNTREPIKRPPLISAISDPALLTHNKSVLLTQLLTNSVESTNVYSKNQHHGFVPTSREQFSNKQMCVKDDKSQIPILPQPPPPLPLAQSTATATLILTPVTINSVQPSTAATVVDPLALNSFSNSNSPIFDNSLQNLNSPTSSSQGSMGSPPNRDSILSTPHRDPKRVGHIHAEQKRRYNIKNGFDMIHSLIPHLNQNPNAKLSKAAMLQKGAEYIRQLRSERNQLKEEMDCLRQEIESLNTSISNCQSLLPATGAPVSRRRDSKMQEMYDEYIRKRTMENWKYWIFSLIFKPLLMSFNNFVSTSSLEDLYRSTLLWIEQHCTLVDLRPIVLNSLRYLCTKTDILSEPEKLPDEARQIVNS